MAVLLDGPAWARRRHGRRPRRAAGRGAGGLLRWPAVERVWLPSWLADPAAVARPAGRARSTRCRPMAPPPRRVRTSRRWSAASRVVQGRRRAARRPVTSVAVRAGPERRAGAARSSPRKPAGPVALEGETPFVPWIPKTAGEKAVLDELPAAKAARVVRRVLHGRDQGRGADPRRPAGQADRRRVRAEPGDRVAQGDAAVAAAAVGGGGRVPVARGRGPRLVDRVPAAGVEHRPAAGARGARGARQRDGRAVPGGAGMRREELLTQTAAVFGYKRRTPAMTPLLEAALKWALAAAGSPSSRTAC